MIRNKILKKGILSIILLILILVGVIQLPNLFIKKNFDYKSFQIYSNEKIELDESVKNILDSVTVNLNKSKFKKESDTYELYFVRGTLYENLLRIFGRKNMAFSKFNKHVYSAIPNFKEGVLTRNNNEYEWLNLVQIISHEGVHSQMYEDHSKLGFMKTPSWINEGYAEYISYSPVREKASYHLPELISKLEKAKGFWIKTEYGSMTPRQYMMDRLLVEYLIDIKGMSIEKIIADESIDPIELYKEIKNHFAGK